MKYKIFKKLAVLMLASLICNSLQAASTHPKTLTLVGNEAETLYNSLVYIVPEAGTNTKSAYISVTDEYDGPGDSSYFAIYFTFQQSRRQVHQIDYQVPSGISEAETLFNELFADGNGLVVHDNKPYYTQTIIDAEVTCAGPTATSSAFKCTVEQ